MLKTTFVVIISICLVSNYLFSQAAEKDTLALNDGFFGMSYSKGNQKLSSEEFKQILKLSPDSSVYALYSKGLTQSTLADVISFTGGFCVGYGLASKPTKSTLTIVGGVIIVAAIIIEGNAKSMMKEAVTKYNADLKSSPPLIPDNIDVKQQLYISYSITF